jgi:hypothetical protein
VLKLPRNWAKGIRRETPSLPGVSVALLSHENARYRDGAVQGLAACGKDAALPQLSKISDLLEDSHDFVRISAARTMANITFIQRF